MNESRDKWADVRHVTWVFADQNFRPEVLRCERCGEKIPTFNGKELMSIEEHGARLLGFTIMHSHCKPKTDATR